MISQTILIADDDPAIRKLLTLLLSSVGYEVQTVNDGYGLVDRAQNLLPDLLIVDVMMPELDGYEALRQLRNDTRTAHIPAIMLTARAEPGALVIGFDSGADDYVTKPFNGTELLARVKSQLRRAARRPVRSPLTGLPGNILITEEIRFRLRRAEPFALLYVDLNNFKAFNDTYGFARGDRVIRLVADVLAEAVAHGGERDFIGHIGGDDFALLTSIERVDTLCQYIISRFADVVRALYEPVDIESGYLEGMDRHGIHRRFPLTSLAIGVVTSQHEQFDNPDMLGRRAAEMKQAAKAFPNGGYVVDGVTGGNTEMPQ